MNATFKKLNFKNQSQVYILNAPANFRASLDDMKPLTTIIETLEENATIEFVLAFVIQQSEVEALATKIGERLIGDAIVWFAYPKKSSKNYQSNITRDQGWKVMGDYGLEGVRMVAIDQDWSALRFRKVEYIKKMTRNPKMALSEKGKQRTSKK